MLRDKSEMDEIHRENLGRLSAMSHDERMKEREELLSSLSEDQIAFIRSLRKGSGNPAKTGREVEHERVTAMEVEEGRREETEGKGVSASNETKGEKNSEERNKVGEAARGDVDTSKAKRERNNKERSTEMEAKEESKTQGTISHTTIEDKTVRSKDEEMLDDGKSGEEVETADTSPQSDLPIPPTEAQQWVHMDKVGHDSGAKSSGLHSLTTHLLTHSLLIHSLTHVHPSVFHSLPSSPSVYPYSHIH